MVNLMELFPDEVMNSVLLMMEQVMHMRLIIQS